MNRPIRTIAIFCMLLFAGAAAQRHLPAVLSDAGSLELSAPRQQAGARRGVLPQARRDPGRRQAGRGEHAESNDQYKYQRVYPQGREVRPRSPATSPTSTAGRGVERSQNAILSGSDPRLFVNRVVDLVGNSQPKGGSVALTIDPKAQTAAYDGLRALGHERRGRGRRARAAHRQDPGDGLHPDVRPEPAGLATTSPRCSKAWKQRCNDHERSRCCNRGDPGGLPARLDLQAGHRGRGAVERAVHPRHHGPGRRRAWTCRRPRTDLVNENGSSCGGDQITLTQALEVSCNVSFGDIGLRARRRRAARRRPRSSASTSTYLDDLDPARSPSRFPGEPRPAADRAVGDRPVRRRGHPAADGDGRRRHRQRRHGDAALPRRRGAVRPTCRRARQDQPRGAPQQRGLARRWPAS